MNRTTLGALALILTAGLFLTAPALAQVFAQSGEPASTFPVSGDESLWPSIGRLAITLVVVLALIWGTLWLARRVTRRGWGGGDATVRVLERTHLAPKKSIEVVAVGERVLVLGVTDTSIALLTEMDPAEWPDPGAASATTRALSPAQSRQKNLLTQAKNRMTEMFKTSRLHAVETTPHA